MFAIIETGGKQYKVKRDAVVHIEKIEGGIGDPITFDKVLMIQNDEHIHVGSPLIDGATVKAEVVEQSRHKKVTIIKFRRRKHSMKRQGHRQYYTATKIIEINGD